MEPSFRAIVALAILAGLLLGLSLAAPPGPMNALIAKEASQRGFGSGVRIGMGAPVADVIYLAALAWGLSGILENPAWIRIAAGAGTFLMLYLSYSTWTGAEPNPAKRPKSFWAGLMAALTNPYQIAWWLSGGFVFLQSQGTEGIIGLLFGIFIWVIAFSWLVAHGANRWTWFKPTIRVSSAALLGFFAIVLWALAVGTISL
jgi:threonine/homoserine/homoserine lactone efflux protein